MEYMSDGNPMWALESGQAYTSGTKKEEAREGLLVSWNSREA